MKKVLPIIFSWALAAISQAGLVAGWDVNGLQVSDGTGIDAPGAPYVFSATTGETTRVTAKLKLGEGVLPSTTTGQYGFKISGIDATNSLAGAIDKNHYLEFSIAPANGYALNLESIELRGGGTATGCSNVVLMSSIEGFVAGQELAAAFPANQLGGLDTDASGFGAPIDLTGGPYSNLTASVSFRIYGWNSSSGSGVTFIRNLSDEDLAVFGELIALPGDGTPSLSLVQSNGLSQLSINFNGTATTNHILQMSTDMVSNLWNTVSGPFASPTNWIIETTNSAAFYRLIAE